MKHTNTGPWGFFDPTGSWLHHTVAWTPFGLVQLLGIGIFIFVFSSLFWASKIHKKIYQNITLCKVLGYMYLSAYFIYYLINILYFYEVLPSYAHFFRGNVEFNMSHFNLLKDNFDSITPNGFSGVYGNCPVSPINDIIPLHISSLAQVSAAYLLIKRNGKYFNLCFPVFAILPLAAILAPSKTYWSFDNYFYWDYYINHTTMLTIFWGYYLYGIKKYNHNAFRWNFIFAFSFILLAWGYDNAFNADLLFVGKNGYVFTNKINTSNFVWKNPTVFLGTLESFIFITLLGVVSLNIIFLILCFINPIYELNDNNQFEKSQKIPFKEKISVYKELFIWNKKIYYKSKI